MPGNRFDEEAAQFWRQFMEHPDTLHTFGRHVFRRLPSNPRCQLCAAPFAGAGGLVMRMIGKQPSAGNPNMCSSCQSLVRKHHGGAEVVGTMLFADIRGSTAMAEGTTSGEFRALLDRFYTVTSEVVFAHGGLINKFVGDELVAAFAPFLGQRFAHRALDAARDVLRATGHADPTGPWVPLGAALHSGPIWFGAIGQGHYTELTMVGDTVNTTARLAAQAQAGEILVSAETASDAGLDGMLPRRLLDLKGKAEQVEVLSLRVSPG